MVIDSSALIAIFCDEPERVFFIQLIAADQVRLIAATTFLEVAIVLERRAAEAWQLDKFIEKAKIEVVPVTRAQAEYARIAYRTFGKGRHQARLNFGDCFSYALSKSTGEPLLQKGTDFKNTDLTLVVP